MTPRTRTVGFAAYRKNKTAVLVAPRQLQELIVRVNRSPQPTGSPCVRAAVFALFVNRDRTRLILIRRADRGDPWSDQIAFPGGKIDSEDAGDLEAAYRETHEEIGIEAGAITCFGELGHFRTNTHAVDLHAFVGLWDGLKPPQANPAEVAGIFEVPLRDLLNTHDSRCFRSKSVETLGQRLVYPLGDAVIWGVTARIIHHLLELF